MAAGHGRAGYLRSLPGVEWQSAMYATGLPADVRLSATSKDGRLPFVFEASGIETHFTNGFDPEPRARRLFNFPRPETRARFLRDVDDNPEVPTWRGKVQHLPSLRSEPVRPAQITAITAIVQLRRADRPRQGQPRHHPAPRRVSRGLGQPAQPGRDRPRDRRGSLRCAFRVRGCSGRTRGAAAGRCG